MDKTAGQPWPDPDGDFVYTGRGQEIVAVPRERCAHGHPIAHVIGWGVCPRCEQHTHVYYCADLRCDGDVTSLAHERECPP